MNIQIKRTPDTLEIQIEGRLDTQTAPELDACIKENLDDEKKLVLDFINVEYISSAGLRSLLSAHKLLEQKEGGLFSIVDPNNFVRDVFDTTGFSDILNIDYRSDSAT